MPGSILSANKVAITIINRTDYSALNEFLKLKVLIQEWGKQLQKGKNFHCGLILQKTRLRMWRYSHTLPRISLYGLALTVWCRIFFENLIVTQFVKNNSPLSLWKVRYYVHKSSPLDPIVSQPNPIRPIDSYCLSSILMLPSPLCLGLPSGLLSSGLPIKTP
jgi:hypothetical protein